MVSQVIRVIIDGTHYITHHLICSNLILKFFSVTMHALTFLNGDRVLIYNISAPPHTRSGWLASMEVEKPGQ